MKNSVLEVVVLTFFGIIMFFWLFFFFNRANGSLFEGKSIVVLREDTADNSGYSVDFPVKCYDVVIS